MTYLDYEVLDSLDAHGFQQREPYPWINPEGALTGEGRNQLCSTLPALSMFQARIGKQRRHGQHPHDRYALEYRPGLELPPAWNSFIGELQSERYLAFLKRMLGYPTELSFHWHFTPGGCSVSPHCDAVHKMGSHIFYLNRREDWNPAWGGETLVLDDGGRFSRRSAPSFEDFDSVTTAKATPHHSFLFARRGDSWHGVRELRCPEGQMRKVFIVVLNRTSWLGRLSRGRWQRRRGY